MISKFFIVDIGIYRDMRESFMFLLSNWSNELERLLWSFLLDRINHVSSADISDNRRNFLSDKGAVSSLITVRLLCMFLPTDASSTRGSTRVATIRLAEKIRGELQVNFIGLNYRARRMSKNQIQ